MRIEKLRTAHFSNLLLISCLLSVSCKFSPVAPDPGYVAPPPVNGIVSKDPGTNFYNQLRLEGINLNNSELDLIRQYKDTKANGNWATSGEEAEAGLSGNFQSLKGTFVPNGPKTENDYLNKALQFAGSENYYARYYFDTSYYKMRNKILVIKWDPQTKEFIVIHTDGRISNYQMAENIGPPRYITLPDNLNINY
jgi:hypothetical protein